MHEVRIIKKTSNVVCYSFTENNTRYFAKLFYVSDNKKLAEEYTREVKINRHLSQCLKDKTYYVKLLRIHENVMPFDYIVPFLQNPNIICNILIYEYWGKHSLRYYINRVSQNTFDCLLKQLKEATSLLQDVDVIHYDLYCQTNIIVAKIKNKLCIKIVDYGLSYIDPTDKSGCDLSTAIESISYFNKKHKM